MGMDVEIIFQLLDFLKDFIDEKVDFYDNEFKKCNCKEAELMKMLWLYVSKKIEKIINTKKIEKVKNLIEDLKIVSAYDKLYIMELDIIKEIVQDIESKGLKLEIIETEDDIQLVLAQ